MNSTDLLHGTSVAVKEFQTVGLLPAVSDPLSSGETRTVNDSWVERLKAEPAIRDAALNELSAILLRSLHQMPNSQQDAGFSLEDVVQDALIKIVGSLDQFAGRSRFTTWALTIAIRIRISKSRRKQYDELSTERTKSLLPSIEVAQEVDATVSTEMDRQSMVSLLRKIVKESLSDKQGFAIQASLAGLSVDAIAKKSGSNRNSVYKLLHDAREKLRQGLRKAGVSADEFAEIFG